MNVFDVSRTISDAALTTAEQELAEGELVVLATDTVYGVAARPDMPGATGRIFAAKRRPRGLTLPVLAGGPAAAEEIAAFDDRARTLAARFWPGGLTIVLPRTGRSRGWDLGVQRDTVGVRVPAHDVALDLLGRTGPLAVTSANRSGEPTPADCDAVRAALADAVAVYLCAGRCAGRPSTLVDLTPPRARVLREGAVPTADVVAALA
jgi:tRNA threonylcarbamoyl adenosine modification protein (Sua5/YciO/YrdC/YwlC family)